MVENLENALNSLIEEAGGFGAFEPHAWLSDTGDCLFVLTENIRYRRRRVNDFLTVYEDRDNEGHIIGGQLKKLTHIRKRNKYWIDLLTVLPPTVALHVVIACALSGGEPEFEGSRNILQALFSAIHSSGVSLGEEEVRELVEA